MSETLRPCPFCGKPGKLSSGEWNGPNLPLLYAADCPDNTCVGFSMNTYKDADAARTAWNTRTPDAEAERLRAALIANIIREVAEIEQDPLPGQPDDEMRVTTNELHAILEAALGERAMPDAQTLEIRRNDDGTLDEIVATGASVHLEQMGGNHWWMSIEAGSRCVHVNLTTAKATIRAECDDD